LNHPQDPPQEPMQKKVPDIPPEGVPPMPPTTPDGKVLHSMNIPVKQEVIDIPTMKVQVYETAESIERNVKSLKKLCLSLIDELGKQSALVEQILKQQNQKPDDGGQQNEDSQSESE